MTEEIKMPKKAEKKEVEIGFKLVVENKPGEEKMSKFDIYKNLRDCEECFIVHGIGRERLDEILISWLSYKLIYLAGEEISKDAKIEVKTM